MNIHWLRRLSILVLLLSTYNETYAGLIPDFPDFPTPSTTSGVKNTTRSNSTLKASGNQTNGDDDFFLTSPVGGLGDDRDIDSSSGANPPLPTKSVSDSSPLQGAKSVSTAATSSYTRLTQKASTRSTPTQSPTKSSTSDERPQSLIIIVVCLVLTAMVFLAVIVGFFLNRGRRRQNRDASTSGSTVVTVINHKEICVDALKAAETLNTNLPQDEAKVDHALPTTPNSHVT